MGVFAKNALITFFSRVLTAVFTIIITVIISRSLGASGQGIYSVAILFPQLLLIFTGLGLNTGVVYFMGKGEYEWKQIFGTTILSNLIISFITILIGFLIIFFGAGKFFPGIEKIYLYLSLAIIPFLLFFNLGCQIFLGAQEIKKYNLFSIFQSGVFLILTALLLFLMNFGITVTILSQIFSFILAILFMWFVTKKITNGVNLKPNFLYLKESLIYGLKIHSGGIFDFLHSRVDLFFINFFINPLSTGIYFVAVKLSEGVWLFSSSASTILFPRVASEKDPEKMKNFTPLVCRNVLLISFLIIIFLFLISGWLINFLYSNEFADSILPFRILLFGVFALSGWHIIGIDLSARGKPMLNTYSIAFSAVLNIFLNIIFIPIWGISGAAMATIISYMIMFLVTLLFYVKISKNKIIDVILIKKEDLFFYKNIFLYFKNKIK